MTNRVLRLGMIALMISGGMMSGIGAPSIAGMVITPQQMQGDHRVFLPLVLAPQTPVAWQLKPFDANVQDVVGPSSWATNYGKTPEIIVASDGTALDVLAQDYDTTTPNSAVLLHIIPGPAGYQVTQALTGLPMLDRVMGLAIDGTGHRYYATAVDEQARVNADYPPLNTYRSDIVRVVKVDAAGTVVYNIDLDIARHAFNATAEMIINPMTFGSARLAVGGGEVALVHAINTAPDWATSPSSSTIRPIAIWRCS